MNEGNYLLTRRFGISLVANILRSAIIFVTGMLLARWMGRWDQSITEEWHSY